MQVTEEELKNMSPEQIRAMQKQNCIFCHIISGKVQSKRVYEDDKVTAVLDINPANPGHILLLTKEHYMIMPQIPDDVISHLFKIAKALSLAALRALKTQGTNIFVANGVVAGQKSPHFMIHVIPRKENDDISSFNIVHKKMSDADLEKIGSALKKKINEKLGIKESLDMDKEPEKIGESKVVEAEFKEKEEDKEEEKEAPAEKEEGEDSDENGEEEDSDDEEEKDEDDDTEDPDDEDDSEEDKDDSGKGADLNSIARVVMGGF